MAVLHPLECYLLELYSSPEYYAATRDAIISWIDAHEAAYNRYQNELPVRTRKDPLWKQGDVVWGTRVLPNIRLGREHYIKAYILRTQDDTTAFNIGSFISGCSRGIDEFWNGWMTETEQERIARIQYLASTLDQALTNTVNGRWEEGHLTYLGESSIYNLSSLPKKIPRYVIDKKVRIEKNELPKQIGIYLPDVDFAPSRLLYPSVDHGRPATAIQGTRRSEWVSETTGIRDYDWDETRYAETGWTLIRRVEGEYINVPPEGFFPKGKPEELYSWPERENNFISHHNQYITGWSGELSPHAGKWSIFTQQGIQYINVNQGQALPTWTNEHGSPLRVQWTLIERTDNGSVYK